MPQGKTCRKHGGKRVLVATIIALFVIALSVPRVLAGQTAADLIERPRLPDAPDTAGWEYQDRYFLENIYTAVQRDGNYANAVAYIGKILESHPENIEVFRLALHIFVHTESWFEAEALLSRWLELRPDATAALVRRAYVRSRLRAFRQSRLDYEEVLRRDPSSGLRRYVEAALSHVAAQREAAREGEAGLWNALRSRVAEMERLGRWPELELLMDKVLERWPESAEGHYARARAYAEQGRLASAKAELAAAAMFDPGDDLKTRIAAALDALDDKDSAGELAGRPPLPEAAERRDGERGSGTSIAAVPPERDAAAPSSEPDAGLRPPAATPSAEAPPPGGVRPEVDSGALAEARREELLKTEAQLRAKEDWAGLEAFFGKLAADPEYAALAYASRAYLRLSQNRLDEAREDFAALLKVNPDAGRRTEAEREIARIDRILATEAEWREIQRRDRELRDREDWPALEAFYGVLAANPAHAAFAYSSRAYLRLAQNRLDEAREDFAALLGVDAGPEQRQNAEREIVRIDEALRGSREWAVIQKRERELRDKEDWAGLEALYGRLVARPRHAAFAYSSRAYLRLGRNRPAEAREDFVALLATDVDAKGRAAAEEMIAQIDADAKTARERRELVDAADDLAKRKDWIGVERLYDSRVASAPDDGFVRAMRGFARLDLGWIGEGEADLEAALALKSDDATRGRIEDVLKRMRESRAEGVPVGSPKVEEHLGRAGDFLAERRYGPAADELAELAPFRLNSDQEARRDYFVGEVFWAAERFDDAYVQYQAASERLSKGFFLSEALWKMADYNRRENNDDLAVAYAGRSVEAMPEAEWRHVQVGHLYAGMNMDADAAASFERAIATGKLKDEESDFYPALARSYLNLGERALFHRNMRRQIDIDAEKVRSKPNAKAVNELYRLRREYANMSKRVGGQQFIFADKFKNGDHLVRYQNEINVKFRISRNIRAEAYFQTVATISSHFSGTYFDTWSGVNRPYSSRANLHDGVNVVLGARVYPFPRYGLALALDHVFRVGRDTVDDTRAHLEYFGAVGNDWKPAKCNWTFASFWADAVYSLKNDDFTLRSEGRIGRSFRADFIADKVVVTPYLGLTSGYAGKTVGKSERLFAEGGPGVMFRKYFGEDKYHAPRQLVDVVVQYKVGLTHKRQNALSVMLYHSF